MLFKGNPFLCVHGKPTPKLKNFVMPFNMGFIAIEISLMFAMHSCESHVKIISDRYESTGV